MSKIKKEDNYNLDDLKTDLNEIGLKTSLKEKEDIAQYECISLATLYNYINGSMPSPALAKAIRNRGFEIIAANKKMELKKGNYNLKGIETPTQEHDRTESINAFKKDN